VWHTRRANRSHSASVSCVTLIGFTRYATSPLILRTYWTHDEALDEFKISQPVCLNISDNCALRHV
jgi:hypothetical protein